MSEQSYLVLLALPEGRQHGYGVIVSVRRLAQNRLRRDAVTLNEALERLTVRGLVRASGEQAADRRSRLIGRGAPCTPTASPN
ncbi:MULTISPECIES: hypothetical protein [Nocardiopsidaceae]|uniref:PadR family transcriptional regulator n=1 Tax=Streptomonospora nanhaiensis TaxID=1323731 RepID=A0ABY6YFA1_9ACTN|nr:hypothetical protein [Streptomonospora nanhaiensis]WAE70916.1 hypothetical protein OUQ99_16890 [Streptomonospora nanhaiensis]